MAPLQSISSPHSKPMEIIMDRLTGSAHYAHIYIYAKFFFLLHCYRKQWVPILFKSVQLKSYVLCKLETTL